MKIKSQDNAIIIVRGIELSSLPVGIRYKNRLDVSLIAIKARSNCVVHFTRNLCPAAPVIISKNHLKKHKPQYFLINAGNANAATGQKGEEDVNILCKEVSNLVGCLKEEVLMFSTGVIGEPLPTAKILNCLSELTCNLKESGWSEASQSIMTTDTFPKIVEKNFLLDHRSYNLVGVCKGSGMIQPNMATMLAFVATDLPLTQRAVEEISQEALTLGFNKITVDGETSTNDSFVMISTNPDNKICLDTKDAGFELAKKIILESCVELAKNIVRDGEGATKLISVKTIGAWSETDASLVSLSVANSLLVKTAIFAEDPNWGRIFSAVGASGAEKIMQNELDIYIGGIKICEKGKVVDDLNEQQVVKVMKATDIEILIDLNAGVHAAEVWTCDLSYDYIKINAEYRS